MTKTTLFLRYNLLALIFSPLVSSFIQTIQSKISMSTRQFAIKPPYYRQTPLVPSPRLSHSLNRNVYYKLDCLQASGSFKDRGMACLLISLRDQHYRRVVSSSGGNAGLAVATLGPALGLGVHVVVPQTTKELVVQKLESLGAKVTISGENWNQADQVARQFVEADAEAAYISPYDHPLLWRGHSTVIDEIVTQLQEYGETEPLAGIVVSVGGGGLLCGVLEGLQRHKVGTVVIAAETQGASSFGQAWNAEEGVDPFSVKLASIDSIATSLGAQQVTPESLRRAQAHGQVQGITCTDADAVLACVNICRELRVLVEPACGAAVAVVERASFPGQGPIVIEVCGGSGVSPELLLQWKDQFGIV